MTWLSEEMECFVVPLLFNYIMIVANAFVTIHVKSRYMFSRSSITFILIVVAL